MQFETLSLPLEIKGVDILFSFSLYNSQLSALQHLKLAILSRAGYAKRPIFHLPFQIR